MISSQWIIKTTTSCVSSSSWNIKAIGNFESKIWTYIWYESCESNSLFGYGIIICTKNYKYIYICIYICIKDIYIYISNLHRHSHEHLPLNSRAICQSLQLNFPRNSIFSDRNCINRIKIYMSCTSRSLLQLSSDRQLAIFSGTVPYVKIVPPHWFMGLIYTRVCLYVSGEARQARLRGAISR